MEALILPKNCRLLSCELICTALTRSRDQLVLLIEGDDATVLFDLARPKLSETAHRNTNICQAIIRAGGDLIVREHLGMLTRFY